MKYFSPMRKERRVDIVNRAKIGRFQSQSERISSIGSKLVRVAESPDWRAFKIMMAINLGHVRQNCLTIISKYKSIHAVMRDLISKSASLPLRPAHARAPSFSHAALYFPSSPRHTSIALSNALTYVHFYLPALIMRYSIKIFFIFALQPLKDFPLETKDKILV